VLAVPDEPIRPGEREIYFNRHEKKVHSSQIDSIRHVTGLNEQFQKDLVRCRLDPTTAKLLYYSYRMALVTSGPGITQLSCLYLQFLQRALEADLRPELPRFWYGTERDAYRRHARDRKKEIETNRRLTNDTKVTECIDEFIRLLEEWGI
jgi:hypothetical protein